MGVWMMLGVFVVVLLRGEGEALSFRGPKQDSVALAFGEEGATKFLSGLLLLSPM
jgi:hypothetical protein